MFLIIINNLHLCSTMIEIDVIFGKFAGMIFGRVHL
jgi:hypothetical protein